MGYILPHISIEHILQNRHTDQPTRRLVLLQSISTRRFLIFLQILFINSTGVLVSSVPPTFWPPLMFPSPLPTYIHLTNLNRNHFTAWSSIFVTLALIVVSPLYVPRPSFLWPPLCYRSFWALSLDSKSMTCVHKFICHVTQRTRDQ